MIRATWRNILKELDEKEAEQMNEEDKKGYFDKNKHKWLPWVMDWHSPQDDIRYSNNVRDMKWADWFWCHPTSYQLIYFGYNILSILMFLVMGIVFRATMIVVVISALLIIFFGFNLIGKLKSRAAIQYVTFYDVFLREY